jgi:hypothetical protein
MQASVGAGGGEVYFGIMPIAGSRTVVPTWKSPPEQFVSTVLLAVAVHLIVRREPLAP